MKCDEIHDVKLFPTVYCRIYCHKCFVLSNQKSRYKTKCIRIVYYSSKGHSQFLFDVLNFYQDKINYHCNITCISFASVLLKFLNIPNWISALNAFLSDMCPVPLVTCIYGVGIELACLIFGTSNIYSLRLNPILIKKYGPVCEILVLIRFHSGYR